MRNNPNIEISRELYDMVLADAQPYLKFKEFKGTLEKSKKYYFEGIGVVPLTAQLLEPNLRALTKNWPTSVIKALRINLLCLKLTYEGEAKESDIRKLYEDRVLGEVGHLRKHASANRAVIERMCKELHRSWLEQPTNLGLNASREALFKKYAGWMEKVLRKHKQAHYAVMYGASSSNLCQEIVLPSTKEDFLGEGLSTHTAYIKKNLQKCMQEPTNPQVQGVDVGIGIHEEFKLQLEEIQRRVYQMEYPELKSTNSGEEEMNDVYSPSLEVERPVLVGGCDITKAAPHVLISIIGEAEKQVDSGPDAVLDSEYHKAKAERLKEVIKLCVAELDKAEK